LNLKSAGKFLGFLISAEAVFLLPPLFVALGYGEVPEALSFLATAIICGAVGGGLVLLCRKP